MVYHALVLFDIDGTLVRRAGPHHREALVQGVRRVTGLETTTESIPVQGMLDPDILAIMMQRAGLRRAQIRHALLGLVTGNLTRIGWRKLECAGLREYFRFGAFGEMAKTRGGLVKHAIREARGKGWVDRKAPVSLIGDAPQDIIAARENGIRSISVQTGITPVAELEAQRPDVFLRDLRALRLRMVE